MVRQYVPMSDPIWNIVAITLKKSYPNMCICWIEKNKNDQLEQQYQELKDKLIDLRGSEVITEKHLFHGTKVEYIDSICESGFKVERNRTSAFGKGTYFSTIATMSSNYTNTSIINEMSYMFVCKVIVGNCKVGTNNEIVNTNFYDNTVNKLVNPTIITTPYDVGAYPEYIVAFYKKAE